MQDGWGPMLMEAAENAGHMIMAALEGVGQMVGSAAVAAKDRVGGAVSAIAALPANAGRAIAINASSAMEKLRGDGGVSQQKERSVQSFMPAMEPAPAMAQAQAMNASVDLDAFRGYDSCEHGVSACAMAPRGQGAALSA